MNYDYKFELDFNDGLGWQYVDKRYIISESVKRKLCFHNNLEPNSNSLQFQMRWDSVIGNGTKTIVEYLLESNDDIRIRVTRYWNNYVNSDWYFTGYLSDNYKVVANHSGIELIDIKAEDGTNKLLKRKYPRNLNLVSKKICDTSNYAQSILKLAFGTGSDASYIPFNLASLPDIDNTLIVSTFSNYEDKTTYDYLKEILFEYGYTFYFNTAGEVVVKSYKPVSAIPTVGFFNKEGSRNIYGKVQVEKNRYQYDDITVNFQTIKYYANVIISTDTTGGDSVNKCNIELAAGEYYPEGAKATDDEGIVYTDYKLESGEKIISVNAITTDIIKDSQISLVESTNLYRRCKLKLVNNGASTYTIRKLDVLGTYVYAEDTFNKVHRAVNGVAGNKYLKYDAKIIHSQAEAEFLAQTFADYYGYANVKYTLKSDAVFDIGDVVKIEEDAISGINTMAQIVEIEDYVGTDLRLYKLIGAGSLSIETVGDTSFLNSSPTVNNYVLDAVTTAVQTVTDIQDTIGTIEQSVIDTAAAVVAVDDKVTAVDVVALEKNDYFMTDKGLLIPMDVYPDGGAIAGEVQEPNYAQLISLAKRYTLVPTFVIVNPIGGRYDANYLKVVAEMQSAGIKVLFSVASTQDVDKVALYYHLEQLNEPREGLGDYVYNCKVDGVWVSNIDPLVAKQITEYAHLKGFYPSIAELWNQSEDDIKDGSIDVTCWIEPSLLSGDNYQNNIRTLIPNYDNYLYNSVISYYDGGTGAQQEEFDATRFKYLTQFGKLIYAVYTNYDIINGGRKYQNAIAPKADVVMKLTVGKSPTWNTSYWDFDKYNLQVKSQMTCDLTVTPPTITSRFGKLASSIEDQYKSFSALTSWQQVIDLASAATPLTPTVSVTEFVSTAELSWEYQSDLGPALKYYEILISKDHDPEDSDPDNGTWWKPRNDGIDWWFEDDDEPLQLTNEFYTYQAPLELDEDDNSIETTYFFKVRRVSTSNSDWGYADATLRPLDSVQIGKDTILAPHIMAGAITADKIAANTITAAHIASVDGGAIRTGNIQSESYSPNSAGWKLALSGSAEFNDVVVRGTVYATDGTFSGSINSGPLMLNKNPPSTTSTTITSGNSVVTWVRALQSAASIVSGSYNCSGTYNSTALGRLELAVTSESVVYEQWQKTGTHTVTSTYWNPWATYVPPTFWTDSFGFQHWTTGYWIGANVTTTVTVEDDVLWRRTETKTTYILKLYSSSNTSLLSTTDWYETGSSWTNTGTTGENKSASTDAPTAASATQGTVTFGAGGSVSFTANAFTYKLLNLPTADTGLPVGTVYQDSSGYLRIKL